jgi:hypothetical protein
VKPRVGKRLFSSKCVLRICSAISDSLRILDREHCGMHCRMTTQSDLNHPGAWPIAVSTKAGTHQAKRDQGQAGARCLLKLVELPTTHYRTVRGICTNIDINVGTTSIYVRHNGVHLASRSRWRSIENRVFVNNKNRYICRSRICIGIDCAGLHQKAHMASSDCWPA